MYMLVAKQNNKRIIHRVTSFNLSQKPCSATGSAPASNPQPPAPEGASVLLFVFNFLDFLIVLLHMYVYISSKVLLTL